MKFCKNCKYFYLPKYSNKKYGYCIHPNNSTLNYTSGEREYYKFGKFADNIRKNLKTCGISAKWFEQKEEKTFWQKLFSK